MVTEALGNLKGLDENQQKYFSRYWQRQNFLASTEMRLRQKLRLQSPLEK